MCIRDRGKGGERLPDGLAKIKARVRLGEILPGLARGDDRPGFFEGVDEGIGLAQGFVEVGFAEIREIGLVAAAEGVPVRCGRRDHQGVVVFQGVDEAAGIAGRDDDDAALDPRFVEQLAQASGIERVETCLLYTSRCV